MLLIDGNPRTIGAVGFTPEILSVLETVPPTEQSLRIAKAIGAELGHKLVETPKGDLSTSQVCLDIYDRHNLPPEIHIALMGSVAETMNDIVSAPQSVAATILSGQQRTAFNKLLGAVTSINNAQQVHPA